MAKQTDSRGGGWRTIAGAVAISVWGTVLLAHPGLHHDLEELTERIAREPASVELRLERAYRLRLAGRPELALDDLLRARELDPSDRRVAAERGLALAALGRDAEAESELTRFLASGRGSAPTLAARSRLRAKGGRLGEAVADLDAAIALDPDPDLYLERSASLRALGRLDDASRGLREGLARLGGAASLREALLAVEIARADWTSALALADETLARSAVKSRSHLRRAEILKAAGRDREARDDLDRALAAAERELARSATPSNLFARARALAALGRADEARHDLTEALRRSPRFTEARELLASIPSPSDRPEVPQP